MTQSRLPVALLMVRLSIFLVMFLWTIDKFINPGHAASVYEHFYRVGGLGAVPMAVIGSIEMAILVGFLVGYRKRLTYGAVFFLHLVSTLSSYKQYLAPFDHLLFFAAWPMLAACFVLYVLRDLDTKLTV